MIGLALALLVALGCAAAPAGAATATPTLLQPPTLDRAPAGRDLSAADAMRIADRLPAVRQARAERPGSYRRAFMKGSDRWQVSYYDRGEERGSFDEIAQVLVSDRDGEVLEVWTGYKVAWTMARGYPGAFGRKANAPYVWLALSFLFVLPFLRRPLRMLHLDLVVLLAFGASYALFNAARIDLSVPTAFALLAYLLGRMLWVGCARATGRAPAEREPLRLAVPIGVLAILVVFLVGFRVGLNLTNANVIDVGYSGVIGADRLADGLPLYGGWPQDNQRGDTYGPVAYYLYVPFEQLLPWSGRWDDLPAAHGAALLFDLVTLALLYLAGRRLRGPVLGTLLAYAWAAYPFTLLTSNSNANDALVAATVLLVLLACGSPVARGAALAFAGLTKFAPFALVPLLATYRGRFAVERPPSALARPRLSIASVTTGRLVTAAATGAGPPAAGAAVLELEPGERPLADVERELGGERVERPLADVEREAAAPSSRPPRRGLREPVPWGAAIVTVLVTAAVSALLVWPALRGSSLAFFWERTLGFQADRGAPFSPWGLYDGLDTVQSVVRYAGLLLALLVAFWPRRRDAVTLAALGAAVLIVLQLGLTYWFYLYLVWFLPLLLIALLAPHREPPPAVP